MALATVAAWVIAGFLLPTQLPVFAAIAALLVVQPSVGGSLKAAVDRLIGTLCGAIYGAVVATLVPHDDALTLGVALAVSLTPLAFAAALSPSFRVAPVTAVILPLAATVWTVNWAAVVNVPPFTVKTSPTV